MPEKEYYRKRKEKVRSDRDKGTERIKSYEERKARALAEGKKSFLSNN